MREGEVDIALPATHDAGLYFIGRIVTPFATRAECPRQGSSEGPVCRIEVDPRWKQALQGLAAGDRVQILYWMHQARRDLVIQNPGRRGVPVGTFAIRSPVRPNPVASSLVVIEAVEPAALLVRGLDCLDGTPLIDIKPERCPHAG